MKFITPIDITDAMLISSSRPEDDYAAWSGATTYGLGDHSISTALHRIYESVQAGNLNHAPTTDNGTWWLDAGPTNRWAMFDDSVGTATSKVTPLTVTIAPGICNALALLDLSGNDVEITITDGTAATAIVYNETYSLADQALLDDWYDYFFAPVEPKDTLIVEDLPPYLNAQITVTITATNTAQTVECGTLAVGALTEIGDTRSAPEVGIIDYSRKETDTFGITSVTERAYAKKVAADFILETRRIDFVAGRLAAVRATPCVWIIDDQLQRSSLVVFGFYRDWGIVVSYPNISEASITLEGLT